MSWAYKLSPGAQRDLTRLPRDRQIRLVRAMEGMSENPFAGDVKALQGAKWKDHYRKRVGSYRIIFAIDRDSTLIEILTILIRSEKTYR